MTKHLYSFDISLANTGVAIFDIETFKLLEVASLKTNSKRPTGERLRAIEQEVLKLMKKYEPFVVVIERGFTQHNTATQQVFRAHGVINCRFWNYPQIEYTTSQWAKIVTGYGKLDKERVQAKLSLNMPELRFDNDNESDAIGIGVAYLVDKHNMPWKRVGGTETVQKTKKKGKSN